MKCNHFIYNNVSFLFHFSLDGLLPPRHDSNLVDCVAESRTLGTKAAKHRVMTNLTECEYTELSALSEIQCFARLPWPVGHHRVSGPLRNGSRQPTLNLLVGDYEDGEWDRSVKAK